MKKSAHLKSDLKEILALEKTLQEQMNSLTASLSPKNPNRPLEQGGAKKSAPPFPQVLGRHLLIRLTRLEAAADRLAAEAEKRGDYKSSLRAVQVSVRVISVTIKLAAQHPHLADDWQPSALEPHSQTTTPPPLNQRAPNTEPSLHPFVQPSTAPDRTESRVPKPGLFEGELFQTRT